MPVHNKFLRNELTSLGLPPDSPRDVEDRDELHLDEHVRNLTYTQIRRVIFTHPNGKTFAVEYEAPIDAGDFEVGAGPVENHGWGRTVTALQVELRPVALEWWMPVPKDGPDPAYQLLAESLHPGVGYREDIPAACTADRVHHQLTDRLYTEAGCREDVARAGAAELLAQHTRELALLLDERHPYAARDLRFHALDLDRAADQSDDTRTGADQGKHNELQEDEGDRYEEILEVISAIAGRLRDATDEGEYHAVGLISDLANGRITVEDARTDLDEITFRHI